MRHAVTIAVLLAAARCTAAPGTAAQPWVEKVYQPSEEVLANPERGLYVEIDDRRKRPLDRARLRCLTDDGVTLLQRLYYLKGYRDRPLDSEQLDLIRNDFATSRAAGMKVILRFAYSSRIGEPDAPRTIVLRHLRQLRPLLRENADLILTVQAGFIGAWGEWHASTNGLTEPEAMREIAFALLDALPVDRTIQVRTPKQKQLLLQETAPLTDPPPDRSQRVARIGHHNDCFLADETDTGTYRRDRLEADRLYVANDSRYVPVGGETCRPGPRSDPERARAELKRMHWSFLNLAYHRRVIAKWRDAGFLDELRRKLGYRLRLVSARFSVTPGVNGALRGEITVANDGWAAPIHDRPIVVVLVDDRGRRRFTCEVACDVRDAYPGENRVWRIEAPLPKGLPSGVYSVNLIAADPSPRLKNDPRYSIRFANTGLRSTSDGAVDLGIEIAVEDLVD